MGKRLINVDEVEEIIPVLVGKLLENNLITEKQADQIICAIFNDNCLGEYGEGDVHQDVETMANACIFSTSETRELLFSHEEYLILEADTTKAVDGKYPLDYATEIIESNLDDIIDYIVQSGTETYNDRTSRGFGNRWSPYNEEERKQVIKLFNSGTWYDTLGSLKHLYYERTPKGLRMCNLTGEPLQANVLEHIEDIILNIKDHYETFAVVPRGKSKLQVYMTISNGTNGAEGCIINSMEDVLNVLKNLRKYKGVNWSQLLEVGIDNADDLYWWYVTFSIDTTAV